MLKMLLEIANYHDAAVAEWKTRADILLEIVEELLEELNWNDTDIYDLNAKMNSKLIERDANTEISSGVTKKQYFVNTYLASGMDRETFARLNNLDLAVLSEWIDALEEVKE